MGRATRAVRQRRTSQLDSLPHGDYEKLCRWLLTDDLSYEDISKKVKKELRITITGHAIGAFYRKHIVKYVAARRKQAVDLALGYVEETERTPGRFATAAMDALQVKLTRASFDPTTSAKELKIYSELLLRWNEQKLRCEEVRLKMRRVRLLEQRHKRLQTIKETALTSDEVANRCRLIFKQNGNGKIIEADSGATEETPETQTQPALTP